MAKFESGVPIVTNDPQIMVDVDRANPLKPGAHRFELVVTDDSGLESEPALIDIVILNGNKPTAVIDCTNGNGQRIDPTTEFGKSFFLSGARSADIDGTIVQYRWTLL